MYSDDSLSPAYANAILSRRLYTDRLSTIISLWELPTLEHLDDWVASYIAQEVVNRCCMQQGTLANTECPLQLIRSTVAYITDDHFFREYYFDLVLKQLGMFMKWYGPSDLPRVPIEATAPCSQTPPEAESPPSTSNHVSRNMSVQGIMCNDCQRFFSREDSLRRHVRNACTYRNGTTSLRTFNSRVTM